MKTGRLHVGDWFDLENVALVASAFALGAVIGAAASLIFLHRVNSPLVLTLSAGYPLFALLVRFREVRHWDRRTSDTKFRYWSSAVLGLAICLGAVLFGRQFEYESLWGDVGVYVNAASHLRLGGEIPFSAVLGTDFVKQSPIDPPLGMINSSADGLWQFHGLPVWPALMAVSQLPHTGKPLLAVLFALNLVLFFHLARRIVEDEFSAALATLVFALVPLAWHQALYATSEMALLTVFLAMCTLALGRRGRSIHFGAGMFAFGVIHTGILILAPITGVVLFGIAASSGNGDRARLARIGFAAALGTLAAYLFARTVSVRYTGDIVAGLFGSKTYLAYVACAGPLIAAVPLIVDRVSPKASELLASGARWASERFGLIALTLLVCSLLVVLVQGYLIGWTTYFSPAKLSNLGSWSARVSYVNRGAESLLHLSMVNIFFGAGGVGLIGLVMVPFLTKQPTVRWIWTFAFCFVAVFGLLRPDIPNNFYASRYFVPVLLPVLLLLAAVLFCTAPISRFLVVPFLAWGVYQNTATLRSHFFGGEEVFREELHRKLGIGGEVVFLGSDWLLYHLVSAQMRWSGEGGDAKSGVKDSKQGVALLVSDTSMVLGGQRDCIEYLERRIPWQIRYPVAPEVHERKVCVTRAGAVQESVLDFGGNRWLTNGTANLVIVGPQGGGAARIQVRSLGWWAEKKPFRQDPSSLKPRLEVCGTGYEPVLITPKVIEFHVALEKSVCPAKLTTEVFVPAKIGEGNDPRSLGVDVHSLGMLPF